MSNNKLYKEDSIQSLSPLEFTRLRPGVYCGSTEYSSQLLIEIVSNAVDEFKAGHGNFIKVDISKDNVITVEDNGQGFIPNSFREDGKSILEASFSVLNTSGKYDENGVYEGTALGLNGIGSKLVCFLSNYMNVITWRDGKYEQIIFTEGVFEKRETGDWKQSDKPSGTKVTWKPSPEFFTHEEVDMGVIKKLFKVISCLCPGLRITLNDEEYYSKNGLTDLVNDAVKKNEILDNRLEFHSEKDKNKIDLVLTYTDSYSSTIVPYVNTGLTESGPHITQIKTILTREMNKFFREKKWLKDKEENLSGDDCQEGMYLVFNITAPGVSYDAQTKSRIVKLNMTPFTSLIAEEIQNWLNKNEKDIKIIATKAINARKAREAARKARDAARQSKEKGLKAKLQLSNKFTDCISKNPKERKLLLVEGTSAAAAAIEARNTQTDCIYQLRGKVISPLKTEVSKLLQNQEISDIIRVIGGGFGKDFDVSKMNFDKIIITTDQDSDGLDIELLLITFFYTYMRPLVEAGKLYRAITPLYIIRQKNKEYYCYTEAEMKAWRETHGSTGYDVIRAKGLGELNAEDLQKVCFKDERFKQILISDAKATEELLYVLQGPSVDLRKKYIYENATELGFHFD